MSCSEADTCHRRAFVAASHSAVIVSHRVPTRILDACTLHQPPCPAGLDMATVEQSMIEFGEDCLKNGTRYRLGPLLKDFLQQYLPPDAHEQCSGNTHVAVTRLLPYWRTKIISKFESRDDLIQALLTSCHIPWWVMGIGD
eukprot:GHRR01029974.1.p1 GENE.GHRR01029974.1~~GHRR01029974.1.p1  ORF type:complete len:141 (-),score=22.57 GHRR01029974.1:316-738(-)